MIALGIDTEGRKHVLGLREGATETAAVATGLLNDLVTRGLPTDQTMLFLVDGARCQAPNCRNVLGHLPERLHAKRAVEQLARSLEKKHPGAAASIREGLDETLTVRPARWRGGQMIQRWVASALHGRRAEIPARSRPRGYASYHQRSWRVGTQPSAS